MARRNQSPRPFRKPFPSALTYTGKLVMFRQDNCTARIPLTKSLTILPSSLATAILNTVLKTRKNECSTTMRLSLDLHEGKAMRNKMARSCLKNDASMLGFVFAVPESGGKDRASAFNLLSGVGCIRT